MANVFDSTFDITLYFWLKSDNSEIPRGELDTLFEAALINILY